MRIFTEIKYKKTFFLLVFLALIPVSYAFVVWSKIGMPFYVSISIALLSVSVFLLPLFLLKMRTAFFIIYFWVIIAPLEIASLFIYQTSARSGVILFTLQSNLKEASEFILSYKIFIALYLLVLVVYPILTAKYIENKHLIEFKKLRYLLLSVLFLFFALLYAYSFKIAYNDNVNLSRNIKITNYIYSLKFAKIYPINAGIATYSGIKSFFNIRTVNKVAFDFKFGAEQTKESTEREIYVFVIGETARSANFGINGYERQTTPKLASTANLISFTDVLSESNGTELSLPILLTRANSQNFYVFKNEKGVVDAFKEAGFQTYWIANQSYGNTFVQRMSSSTNESFFTPMDFDDEGNYDEKLWVNFDKILAKDEKKQFIVLHTLGSHFRYNQRYPLEYEKFVPSLKGLTGHSVIGERIKTELINSYDNSILYTDYFLAGTIEKLRKTDAVSYMLYISDHGESLFDNNVIFHGSLHPALNEVHVPLLVWSSNKYNKMNPEKIEALKINSHKKMTSDIVFHSLLDMANVRFDGFSTKYITNMNLEEDSIRYIINTDEQIVTFK